MGGHRYSSGVHELVCQVFVFVVLAFQFSWKRLSRRPYAVKLDLKEDTTDKVFMYVGGETTIYDKVGTDGIYHYLCQI